MTEPPEVTVPPEGGRDDYSGPFDPDFRYEDLSRDALVKLVREFALIAHLLDRSVFTAVGMKYGQQAVEELAIAEWMGASPIYTERIRKAFGIEGVELPFPDTGGNRRSWFVYVVKLPAEVDRDATIEALRARGVDSKPYLPAIHLMSFYRERFNHREGEFPVCEDVARRSLALPFFPQITEGQVAQVAESLGEVLAEARLSRAS